MDLNMELAKGTLLQGGKYKIEAVLGQGSFGITYLASAKFSADGGLGKMDVVAKVAIKEFFMSEINTRKEDGSTVDGSTGNVFTNYRKKFRKEAENLAKLSHSNIVKVFDVFDENGTTYYTMEYLDGDDLDGYIKQKDRLGEDETIRIIREVGEAIAYMHSKKMLHLDIKPKNIMHRSDSGNTLIDFGLSKQYTDDGEPESSTSIGLGTPGYAPLEQAQYTQDGTFPSTLDVYALGATMFKMLTGKRPPEATMILNNGFPQSELAQHGISDKTIGIVRKAMSPKKQNRYRSIQGLVNALNRTTADQKQTTIEEPPRPTAEATPTPKSQKRNKFTTACLVIGVIWFSLLSTICSVYLDRSILGYVSLYDYFEFIICVFYLFFSIRLLANKGLGKFLPFALSLLLISLTYARVLATEELYEFNDWIIFSLLTLIPYIFVLYSLKLKNSNGISGFKLLEQPTISFPAITQVWRDRNSFINLTTVAIAAITFFGVYDNRTVFSYILRHFEDAYFWDQAFYYIAWMIGSILLCLGYRLGCWFIWYGTLINCTFHLHYFKNSTFDAIIIIIPLAVQLFLLIRKDGKSAISAMV